MSDLQRPVDVWCTDCHSEIYFAANGISDDRYTVNFVPACDCQVWPNDGEVPDSWVDRSVDE